MPVISFCMFYMEIKFEIDLLVQDFKILLVHSDTWKCATWGHITCTNIKKNMTKWTWDYNCKIQKFNNTIHIGILPISDKTISMRTRKTTVMVLQIES